MEQLTDSAPLYRKYLNCPVTFVGAGGIVSNLLGLIVKCGPTHLTIWDDDIVQPVNLAQQDFLYDDIGEYKADVLAYKASQLDPELMVNHIERRFAQGDRLDGIVVAGVDSMGSRRIIFDKVCQQAEQVPLFIDGRLSRKWNEFVDLYFIDPKRPDEVEFYREWLFEDGEVEPKGPRPKKLSAHTPILLAGLVGAVLARWVHEGRHPLKVTLDASTFQLETFQWRPT